MAETQYRIRIRLPNGAEMEAAGTLEYVREERRAFLTHYRVGARTAETEAEALPEQAPAGQIEEPAAAGFTPRRQHPAHMTQAAESDMLGGPAPKGSAIRSPIWDSVIEVREGPSIQLRAKLQSDKTDKDACLLLLMAAQKVLNLQKPTAAQLARWLRASGYPVQRVDRVLADAIDQGEIMASGSRRARRYELTAPGRVKGFLLAQQMTQRVHGDEA